MNHLTVLQSLIFACFVVFTCFGIGTFTWVLSEKRERALLVGLCALPLAMFALMHLVGP